jgi:sorting and assembly machinery component 37
LDVILAAHILLLIKPPYPSAVLKDLVKDSFPTLALHAQRIYERTIGPSHPVAGTKYGAISVGMPTSLKVPECKRKIKSPEDIYYDRMRWAFFGLSIGSLAAYLVVVGAPVLKQLKLVQAQPRSVNDIGVDLEDAEDLGSRLERT